MGTYDETETIVAIDGSGAHRGMDCCDFRLGIDVPFTKHADIAIETGHAVGIDAAKVRGGENVGGLGRVVFGDAEVKEDARAKFAQGIAVKNFGLDGGHVRPFFAF